MSPQPESKHPTPIRRTLYAASRAQGLDLLRQCPVVHVATTTPDGSPMLKTVHSAVVDQWLVFHGAPAGEKMQSLGRDAVVSASQTMITLPSYLFDPQRACPATTYYASVQVHGRLEAVDEPHFKARALQALMERHQPEGGHVPITADDPLYRAAVRGLLIVRVALDRVTCKIKIGQNRKPHQRTALLEALWHRGDADDPYVIAQLREAYSDMPEPDFLKGAPPGVSLRCHLYRPEQLHEAVGLLTGAYWNPHLTPEQIGQAWAASPVRVGAVDVQTGALIGIARALTDRTGHVWIYDVMVAPNWRGRGVGRAVVGLLLDHPQVRAVPSVLLATRDAQSFYASLGFKTIARSDRAEFSVWIMEHSGPAWKASRGD
ncbi:MAG: GNAT family N-acetyltransferase [Myxococcota bacterium]